MRQRMQEERRFHGAGLVPKSQGVLMGPCPPTEGVLWVSRHKEGPLQPRMAGATPGVAETTPARAGHAGIRGERGVNVHIHLPSPNSSFSSFLFPSFLTPPCPFHFISLLPSSAHSFSLDLFSASLAIWTESWVAANIAASPGASPPLGGLYRVLCGFSPTPGPQDQL